MNSHMLPVLLLLLGLSTHLFHDSVSPVTIYVNCWICAVPKT